MGLPIQWLSHLPKPDQAEFEQTVRASTAALGRLREIISHMADEAETRTVAARTYDSPSWAFIQADLNGYKRFAKDIDRILSFMDTK